MSQNNLLDVVNFMKENKTFSDYNFINEFMSSLNFTKYRFNINTQKNNTRLNYNNKMNGGNLTSDSSAPSLPPPIDIVPQIDTSAPFLPGNSFVPPINPTVDTGAQMVPSVNASIQVVPSANTGVQMVSPVDASVQMVSPGLQQITPNQDIIPEIEELNEEINEFGNSELTAGINDNADCVYKKIKNSDGTYITQKICGQKIVTMPDMFLPKPTFMYSDTNTYTIKKGTILYHATVHKRGFNTNEIRLGKDKLISFFTPNFRLASDKIEGCSIDKQKGFIHVFRVKTDIPDIFIKLPYDTDEDLDLDELKDKFCNGNEYYKGVGFFYPKNEIELFNNSIFNQRTQEMHENLDDDSYYSEFALCSPNDYLTYLYSQKCMSLRKLSQPYRFDGKNYN